METASNPRAPFWGCPLGLVSWTEQRSKTHMSDKIMPCEAYHPSGIWQKGRRRAHIQGHTLWFEDRAFWMAALADEETAVTSSLFVCVLMWMCLNAFVCIWKFVYLLDFAYALFFVYGHVHYVCVCVSHCYWTVIYTHKHSHTLLMLSPTLCPLCRWHMGLSSSILSSWSLSRVTGLVGAICPNETDPTHSSLSVCQLTN